MADIVGRTKGALDIFYEVFAGAEAQDDVFVSQSFYERLLEERRNITRFTKETTSEKLSQYHPLTILGIRVWPPTMARNYKEKLREHAEWEARKDGTKEAD